MYTAAKKKRDNACAATMSIAVELTDRHRNELRVEVPLDATVGALRNAVNGALPRGYVIEEHDVVPKPFAHYVEDDPECFRGPADGWRLAEVFFDELAAEPLEAVRCRATTPLGPPRAVAVLFPGERAVTQRDFVGADAAFLEAAATLRGYAPRAALAGDERARRDAWVVLPLAALEAKLRSGQLARADVGAVCGFGALAASPSAVDARDGSRAGAAGEAAALVFCGALSLEAALELVDARHDALKGVSAKAVSVVGDADVEDGLADASKHGEIAVSHDLCPGVRVVSGSRDAVAALEVAGAVLTETDARQGAHSPLAADAAAAYDALLVRALAGAAELAHPLHVRRRPGAWPRTRRPRGTRSAARSGGPSPGARPWSASSPPARRTSRTRAAARRSARSGSGAARGSGCGSFFAFLFCRGRCPGTAQ